MMGRRTVREVPVIRREKQQQQRAFNTVHRTLSTGWAAGWEEHDKEEVRRILAVLREFVDQDVSLGKIQLRIFLEWAPSPATRPYFGGRDVPQVELTLNRKSMDEYLTIQVLAPAGKHLSIHVEGGYSLHPDDRTAQRLAKLTTMLRDISYEDA